MFDSGFQNTGGGGRHTHANTHTHERTHTRAHTHTHTHTHTHPDIQGFYEEVP